MNEIDRTNEELQRGVSTLEEAVLFLETKWPQLEDAFWKLKRAVDNGDV